MWFVPSRRQRTYLERKQKNQTEVFAAKDVNKKVTQAVRETLGAAVQTWGSSGRLEYWILGTDRDAAIELGKKFCERRVARGHMTRNDCLMDNSNKDHGFLMYQEIGAKALPQANRVAVLGTTAVRSGGFIV